MTTAQRTRGPRPGAATAPPLPRRWAITGADLQWITIGLGLLLAGMWLRHGIDHRFGSIAEIAASVGQLTAIYGTLLALVGIALLSRAPWIDQVVGSDEAARLHRLAGFASVWLLAVHVVASSMAWASTEPITSPAVIVASIIDFTLQQPGGLGATIAFALFVVVAVVSIRAARARLPYETWYGIHLYVYLAVVLGFLHQIKIGSDFATDPVALWTWIALYAIALAPLLVFRVLEPIARNLRHRFYVERVTEERPGVVSITIAGRAMEKLPVRAGQWFGIRVLNGDGWWRSHPYSLSAGPDGRTLRFTVEALGDRSRELQRLKVGTRIFLEGPYGVLTGVVRTKERVLLIAGGIGITPLRALLEVLPARRGDIALLYRSPSKNALVLNREIDRISELRGIRVDYVIGSRESFRFEDDPLSAAGLLALYPDIRERDVYLCGSPNMMERVEKSLRELRVPRRQVHLERFAW